MNGTVHAGLDSQASGVHSSEEPHIQSLLDWLKEVHHQVVSDVVAAEREIIFVIRPTAFHKFGFEPLLLEKALLVSAENGSFASETDKADLHVLRVNDFGGGFLTAAGDEQNAEETNGNDLQ